MAKRGFIRVHISKKSLPAGVRGFGQPPTAVSPLEHITRGVNQALNDCGPGNILRELANMDRKELDLEKKELDRVNTKNAHLNAQVSAMSQ